MNECLLWNHAKTLAKDKGFTMHGECPVNSSCDGSFCVFVSPLEDSLEIRPTPTEKFYARLDRWEELGLARLRQELAKVGGQK